MTDAAAAKSTRNVFFIVLVASLGYFVDIYDLLVFSITRVPSLKALGITNPDDINHIGTSILNWQMGGLLIGGLLWGIIGDKLGRIRVLFGSILLYSVANFLNGRVTSIDEYIVVRFIAGIGLAGELGAGITLVAETMTTTKRGYGTMIVSVIGLLGAAAANLVAKTLDWHWAYYIGGILGIFLLLLRLGTFESGLYKQVESKKVSRGNFLMLFTSFSRFIKYLYCILVGAANWFIIGILITKSPEFGRALHAKQTLNAGDGVFYAYIGIAIGGLFAGLLSQLTKSRRLVVAVFILLSAISVVCYLNAENMTTTQFTWLSLFLGVGVGYWPIFVTIPAEQFGTNIRATVTTTVPNFIRASLIPISFAFDAFATKYHSMITSAYIMIAILSVIALFAISQLKESFHKDLDYVEPM